ncbi:MAG TPA: hypothetical protein P5274_01955 [Candidatus Paceibacterota bacterium]|nr:hypothetical protein [Candidatus Paceibacterota bacterium]
MDRISSGQTGAYPGPVLRDGRTSAVVLGDESGHSDNNTFHGKISSWVAIRLVIRPVSRTGLRL